MSVLIRGMDMPTSCIKCKLCVSYKCVLTGEIRWSDEFDYDSKRFENCPLRPVPPHGRLIDADALMLKIFDYIDEYSDVDEKGWHNLKWCAMKETEMAINDAPTILEAEEGEA